MTLLLVLATAVAATAVDISPLLNGLIEIASTVLIGVIGWAVAAVAKKFHVDAQNAISKAVVGALDNGISYAAHVAGTTIKPGMTIDVKNTLAASAAQYVVDHFPQWTKNLDFAALIQTALAKLPQ